MYDQLLVPVDGSESATAALEHALDIAVDYGATVHAITVADTNTPSLTRIGVDVIDALVQEGATVVSEARDRGEKRDVSMITEVIQGDPAEVIVDYTTTYEIDLVVMGTRGQRKLDEYVLGSVTDNVVNACAKPVLTVRAADEISYPYETILVPTDGSDHATTAVERGSQLASQTGAALQFLFVVNELPLGFDIRTTAAADQLETEAQTTLQEAVDIATEHGVAEITTHLQFGSVRDEITAVATDQGVDLIVMGTHGRRGLDEKLLGSSTERVLRTAPVPVLTIGSRKE
jgi:nucleotide-binding universal stress UspA family protein